MLPHHDLQVVGGGGIQPHEGLVHHNELRLVEPRGDDGQLLLHTVGIGVDGLGQIRVQAEPLRQRLDAFRAGRPYAVDIRHEVQISDPGEEIVQVRVIRDIGQRLFRADGVGYDIMAADGDLSLVKPQQPAAGFQRGGLARPVVADKAVDLPRGDIQGQIVHGGLIAVFFGQMFDVQHIRPSV